MLSGCSVSLPWLGINRVDLIAIKTRSSQSNFLSHHTLKVNLHNSWPPLINPNSFYGQVSTLPHRGLLGFTASRKLLLFAVNKLARQGLGLNLTPGRRSQYITEAFFTLSMQRGARSVGGSGWKRTWNTTMKEQDVKRGQKNREILKKKGEKKEIKRCFH